MLHSKTILSSQTGASKLFCIGFSSFWSRCRNWGLWSFQMVQKRPKSTKMGQSYQNDKRIETHFYTPCGYWSRKSFIFCGIKHLVGEPWQCLGRLPTIVGREQSPAAVLIVWRPIQYRFALNCIALWCVLHFPQRSMHNLLICFFEHRTATFLPCFVLCHTCLLLTILIVCLDWVSHRFMFIF